MIPTRDTIRADIEDSCEMVQDDLYNNGPEAERRKVRKGTQSCWECRRRKVRCISSSAVGPCDHCHRRGATCISQEYPDISPSSTDINVGARLSRVERLLEQLLCNPGPNSPFRRSERDNDKPALAPEPQHNENIGISPTISKSPFTPRPDQVQDRRTAGKYEALTRELISAWPSQCDIDLICTLRE